MLDFTVSSSSLQSEPMICWNASVTDVQPSSMRSLSCFLSVLLSPVSTEADEEEGGECGFSVFCPCMVFAALLSPSRSCSLGSSFRRLSFFWLVRFLSLLVSSPTVPDPARRSRASLSQERQAAFVKFLVVSPHAYLHGSHVSLPSRRLQVPQLCPLRASIGSPGAASAVPIASCQACRWSLCDSTAMLACSSSAIVSSMIAVPP